MLYKSLHINVTLDVAFRVWCGPISQPLHDPVMRKELFRQNSWLIPAAFEVNRAIYYDLHFNSSPQLPSRNMTFVDSSERKIPALINGT